MYRLLWLVIMYNHYSYSKVDDHYLIHFQGNDGSYLFTIFQWKCPYVVVWVFWSNAQQCMRFHLVVYTSWINAKVLCGSGGMNTVVHCQCLQLPWFVRVFLEIWFGKRTTDIDWKLITTCIRVYTVCSKQRWFHFVVYTSTSCNTNAHCCKLGRSLT